MEFTVEIARCINDVLNIREAWEQLQWHPNSDIDFYLEIVNARQEIERPHVIIISSLGQPVCIVVGRIEDQGIDFKIGYKTFCSPKIRTLYIIYGGLLGDVNVETSNIILTELVSTLHRHEVDAINVSFLGYDTGLYKRLGDSVGLNVLSTQSALQSHWRIILPATFDAFLKTKSSKRRHEIQRYIRVLDKAFSGQVGFKTLNNENVIDQLLYDVEEIAKETYHRRIGVGFFANDEFKKRLLLWSRKNKLRAIVLYINNRPCAFIIGTQYSKALYLDYTGYLPEYKKYELGTILLHNLIESIYMDNEGSNISVIDFGLGDAGYKQLLCNDCWNEASVFLLRKTFVNCYIYFLMIAINVVNAFAKRLLKKIHIDNKVRKYLRNN